jgi:hypothetical protein
VCWQNPKELITERKKLRHSNLLFSIILIAVIVSPIFLVVWVSSIKQSSTSDFFVGVEYAIDNESVEDVKDLIDRVKNFTNLFVVDSLGITTDIFKLQEVCDYVYDQGLSLLVFFISMHYQQDGDLIFRYNFYPNLWVLEAKEKYGDKFLGIYVFDEPGGNQLDQGTFQLVPEAEDQAEAAENWVDLLDIHLGPYAQLQKYEDYIMLTAEYGLYWFDYKAGYDTILTEFASNHSRPLHVALCRGAAKVQNREWGMIVTWTYNELPYLVSRGELYEDLVIAYRNGAKYVVIFDYPETEYSEYGILTEEHFDALEDFWNYINDNPGQHGTVKADVVYVLPENYGFGFRNAEDNIWGLWSADTDERSEKIWIDVSYLVDAYGFNLDIVYSDPEFKAYIEQLYDIVIYWSDPVS